MSNIVYFGIKYISDCNNNIGNGFVTIKLVRKDLLHMIIGPIDQKLFFQYGRWRPFWKWGLKRTLPIFKVSQLFWGVNRQTKGIEKRGFIYVPMFSRSEASESYLYLYSIFTSYWNIGCTHLVNWQIWQLWQTYDTFNNYKYLFIQFKICDIFYRFSSVTICAPRFVLGYS